MAIVGRLHLPSVTFCLSTVIVLQWGSPAGINFPILLFFLLFVGSLGFPAKSLPALSNRLLPA